VEQNKLETRHYDNEHYHNRWLFTKNICTIKLTDASYKKKKKKKRKFLLRSKTETTYLKELDACAEYIEPKAAIINIVFASCL